MLLGRESDGARRFKSSLLQQPVRCLLFADPSGRPQSALDEFCEPCVKNVRILTN
jgi:hypothetical protein